MNFFRNRKKETSAPPAPSSEAPEIDVVYRDGVFEAYIDKTDGQKYGRTLKSADGKGVPFRISDEDFEMWRDAAKNFGKYTVTYERGEDFFIKNVSIARAGGPSVGKDVGKAVDKAAGEMPSDGKDLSEKGSEGDSEKASDETPQQSPARRLTPAEKEELSRLVAFYNRAVSSPDAGEAMLSRASFDEKLAAAALCERKIAELAKKAQTQTQASAQAKAHDGAAALPPEPLRKLAAAAKKSAFQTLCGEGETGADDTAARCGGLPYCVYSEYTGRPFIGSGSILFLFGEKDPDAARPAFGDGHVRMKALPTGAAVRQELADAAANGMTSVLFIGRFGLASVFPIDPRGVLEKLPFPENAALRRRMTFYFQSLRSGALKEPEKHAACALGMYDALFRATLLQPCLRRAAKPDGGAALDVSVLKATDGEGTTFFDLYSSVALLQQSEAFRRYQQTDAAQTGYKIWKFPELCEELRKPDGAAKGFSIDGGCIPALFDEKKVDLLLRAYRKWQENGGSFSEKSAAQDGGDGSGGKGNQEGAPEHS